MKYIFLIFAWIMLGVFQIIWLPFTLVLVPFAIVSDSIHFEFFAPLNGAMVLTDKVLNS